MVLFLFKNEINQNIINLRNGYSFWDRLSFSTFGILGVGFVLGEYDTSCETRISKNLIYKETPLGNAISDYRGKRVEIYKTISWLPIIEWRILNKEYYNVIPYLNRLNVDYHPETKTIYLNAEEISAGKIENWVDTLKLKE